MATIIYYGGLDYDLLPTSKKRRLTESKSILAETNQVPTPAVPPHRRKQAEPEFIIIEDDDSSCNKFNSSSPDTGFSHINQNGRSSTGTSFNSTSTYTSEPYSSYNKPNSSPNIPDNGFSHTNHNGRSSTGTSFNSTSSYTSESYSTRNKLNSSPNIPDNRFSHSNQNNRSSFNAASTYLTESYSSFDKYSPAECRRSTGQSRIYRVAPTTQKLHETLRKYFKFDSFRENQLEAVNATCTGLDTLILMPTGGGKSICYQLPAILSDGVTVVVSPLKALIADQVERMRKLYVRTSALFGDTSDQEAEAIHIDLKSPEPQHKLLFVTPEKINASGHLMSIFKQLHKRNLLARFVIDEAHCVSMWGSDFRPDYRKLGKLRDLFCDVPIMALTATAPPKVRDDILDQLQMDKSSSRIFIQSFNRPNLKFEVRDKSKGCLKDISNMIRANFSKQCGIIYCLSRNDCEQVAENMRENGITSAPYHAGLSDESRKKVFSAWSRGTFQVVCATIAFGMGIDKADVRFVIHYSMPKSIEGYYQEAGRAGRDGKFASCILYFSKSDLYRMRSMLSKTGFGRKAEDKKRDQGNLQHMIDYVDNKSECRRRILLRYLGEEFNSAECIKHFSTACDNCLAKKGHRDF